MALLLKPSSRGGSYVDNRPGFASVYGAVREMPSASREPTLMPTLKRRGERSDFSSRQAILCSPLWTETFWTPESGSGFRLQCDVADRNPLRHTRYRKHTGNSTKIPPSIQLSSLWMTTAATLNSPSSRHQISLSLKELS